MAMREFDFSPLFRSAIGFDRMMDLLQNALEAEPGENYPPYDIEKTGEDAYRITLAVAGFTPEEISVVQQQNELLVSGRKHGDDNTQYLHRGIAARSFQRRFELADFVKVTAAGMRDGLLTVDLVREVPEEMKPRRIEITGGPAAQPTAIGEAPQPKRLEKHAA
jgi:molecular chaperone IbpA